MGICWKPKQRVAPVRHRDSMLYRGWLVERQPTNRHFHFVRSHALHHRLLQHDPDPKTEWTDQADSTSDAGVVSA